MTQGTKRMVQGCFTFGGGAVAFLIANSEGAAGAIKSGQAGALGAVAGMIIGSIIVALFPSEDEEVRHKGAKNEVSNADTQDGDEISSS